MRVLVTRPASRAGLTERRLAAMGHQVVASPVLTIVTSGAPMPSGAFDALILTSPGALLAFTEPPVHLPVLAVGDRTADDARKAGFLHVLSAAGDRIDLAELARETLPPARRLLMAVGRERKEDLADMLRSAGHEPVIWVCYHADAVAALEPAAASALAEGRIDWVMHYSPRSAGVFIELARQAGVAEALRTIGHVSISDDATQVLAAAGCERIVTAGHPDENGMLAAFEGAVDTGQ